MQDAAWTVVASGPSCAWLMRTTVLQTRATPVHHVFVRRSCSAAIVDKIRWTRWIAANVSRESGKMSSQKRRLGWDIRAALPTYQRYSAGPERNPCHGSHQMVECSGEPLRMRWFGPGPGANFTLRVGAKYLRVSGFEHR